MAIIRPFNALRPAADHAAGYPRGSCPRNTSHLNKPFYRLLSDQ